MSMEASASTNDSASVSLGPGTHVHELLTALDEAATETGQSSSGAAAAQLSQEQQLVSGRLGMASSLYSALHCKHAPTASHSLRVALGCSAWAASLEMPDKLRTQLEAAALLHDIGKIAVPDAILCKPGRLTPAELQTIDRSREAARHILSAAGAPKSVVDGVIAASAWFDGSHRSTKLTGEETPVISRMIAIVDAFDAMTTDQVYRPARSKDRAIATLFEQSGSQFDPDLVTSYCDLFSKNQSRIEEDVASRWVSTLSASDSTPAWTPVSNVPTAASVNITEAATTESLFASKLIGNMHDAVVFVDERRHIFHWNVGAERLTGVGSSAACGKLFAPSLIDMSNSEDVLIGDADCPVSQAVQSGLQSIDRVNVMGRNGRSVSVDLHVIPVGDADQPRGAVVLFHDASSEASLEERCQSLHAEMTKDPMTQVANRAEFDRMLIAFVDAHEETGLPCSLIMADIDNFKAINDTFGHQAGDEAIITVASLLKSMCRAGDVVARYGGEEFAVLCADCNNSTATKRAEQIRRKLAETTHTSLGGKRITASFGVTELQQGDTPDTMLRRADRGLLQAKDQGRNQVVQLGDGMSAMEKTTSGWFRFGNWGFRGFRGGALIETRLVTNVPIELAVEKLRGFIADRDATILNTSENHLKLEVTDTPPVQKRGEAKPTQYVIDLKLSQEHIEKSNAAGFASGSYVHTFAEVKLGPKRDRDRTRSNTTDRARLLLGNLKSYLMAKELDASGHPEEQDSLAQTEANVEETVDA